MSDKAVKTFEQFSETQKEPIFDIENNEVKIGSRVKMVEDMDDIAPVVAGTEGIVKHIDGIGQLHVDWENTSSNLAVIPGVDSFVVLID